MAEVYQNLPESVYSGQGLQGIPPNSKGSIIQRYMTRFVVSLTLMASALVAQTSPRLNPAFPKFLSFETDQKAGDFPAGWGGSQNGTIVLDDQVVHGGRWSARIERTSASTGGFST